MAWAILDTSVYIGHWERGLYTDTLELVRRRFIVRHSAVVLSELRRGARTREAERRDVDNDAHASDGRAVRFRLYPLQRSGARRRVAPSPSAARRGPLPDNRGGPFGFQGETWRQRS